MEPPGPHEELSSGGGSPAQRVCQEDVVQGQGDNSTIEMMRIKEQMSNQCFEMAVTLQAGKSEISWSPSSAERDLQDYVSELEEAKTMHYNKTLALHRMQVWYAIAEKLKEDDPEAEAMRELTNQNMDLCSTIKTLQQESCELQDQIADLRKQRLELKRLTHEKMKEMEELKRKKEHPEGGQYRSILEKGLSHLEKYRKMAAISKNVLRGVILASRVNWRDDPKLRDIVMTLEDCPLEEKWAKP